MRGIIPGRGAACPFLSQPSPAPDLLETPISFWGPRVSAANWHSCKVHPSKCPRTLHPGLIVLPWSPEQVQQYQSTCKVLRHATLVDILPMKSETARKIVCCGRRTYKWGEGQAFKKEQIAGSSDTEAWKQIWELPTKETEGAPKLMCKERRALGQSPCNWELPMSRGGDVTERGGQ